MDVHRNRFDYNRQLNRTIFRHPEDNSTFRYEILLLSLSLSEWVSWAKEKCYIISEQTV